MNGNHCFEQLNIRSTLNFLAAESIFDSSKRHFCTVYVGRMIGARRHAKANPSYLLHQLNNMKTVLQHVC